MDMATDVPGAALAGDPHIWSRTFVMERTHNLSFDASPLDDPMADTSMQDPPATLLPSTASQSGFGSSSHSIQDHGSYSLSHSPTASPDHAPPRSPTPPPPVISSALDDGPDSALRLSSFDSGSSALSLARGSGSSFRMSPQLSTFSGDLSAHIEAANEDVATYPRSAHIGDIGSTAPSISRSRHLRLSAHVYPASPSLHADKPHGSTPMKFGKERYAHLFRRSSDEQKGEQPVTRDSHEPITSSWPSSRLSSGSEGSGEAHAHTHRPNLLPQDRFAYETPRMTSEKRVLRSATASATASALRPSRHAPWSTAKTPRRAKRVSEYVDLEEEGVGQAGMSTSTEDKENKTDTPGEENPSLPTLQATIHAGKAGSSDFSLHPDSPRNRGPLKEVKVNSGSRHVAAGPEPRSGSHLPGYELGAGAEEDEADNEEQALPFGPRQPSSGPATGSAMSKGMRVSSAGAAELASSSSQPACRTGLAARSVSQPPLVHNNPSMASIQAGTSTLVSLPIEEATAVLAQTPEQEKFGTYVHEVLKEAARQATYDPDRIAQWLGKGAGKDWKDFKPTTVHGLRYRKIRKAGEGGFSTVWIVRGPFERVDTKEEYADDQQAFFAMKQVNLKKLEPQSREDVLKEAEHLEALSHRPGYDKYMLRYFAHKANDSHLKILIELGDCDFSDILRRQQLERWHIPKVFGQMCEAVHFLHTAGIVHTDLKPANFLRAGDSIKIIDLGIAQKIPKGTIHISREALVGTPNYMAPETVKLSRTAAGGGVGGARPALFKAGIASDVWAMGCILYQLVYGRPPFDKLTGEAKLRAIVSEKTVIDFPPTRPPPYPSHPGDEGEVVDEVLLDAMKSALQYHVANRATLPQLLDHRLMAPYTRSTEEVSLNRDAMYLFFTRLRELILAGRIIPGTEAGMIENFFRKMPRSVGSVPPEPDPWLRD